MKTCFKKKSKKGFTLIELSIVLLVLAFLVGGVLVGKKIVDRSKVQSIVSQISDMRKAVDLFSNNYEGFLPGDIKKERLVKFPEYQNYSNCTNCGNEDGIIDISWEAFHAMKQLEVAGYTSNVPNAFKGGTIDATTEVGYSEWAASYDKIMNETKKANFNGDVRVLVAGIKNSETVNRDLFVKYFNELTSSRALGSGIADFYDNSNYIMLFNMDGMESATAVSASNAAAVDDKIDDKKPYSGNLLAGARSNYDRVGEVLTVSTFTANTSYCSTITTACIQAGNCTENTFITNNKYQTSAPDSIDRGCNLFYKLPTSNN